MGPTGQEEDLSKFSLLSVEAGTGMLMHVLYIGSSSWATSDRCLGLQVVHPCQDC